MLREKVRRSAGKNAHFSIVIIDSQSFKTNCKGSFRVVDSDMRMNGCKRHLVVDTLGRIVLNIVHPANVHDSKRVDLTIRNLKVKFHGIKLFTKIADIGQLIDPIKKEFDYELKISPKMKD